MPTYVCAKVLSQLTGLVVCTSLQNDVFLAKDSWKRSDVLSLSPRAQNESDDSGCVAKIQQGSLYYQPKQCTVIRDISQNDHPFALFGLPRMGNLMTPVY